MRGANLMVEFHERITRIIGQLAPFWIGFDRWMLDQLFTHRAREKRRHVQRLVATEAAGNKTVFGRCLMLNRHFPSPLCVDCVPVIEAAAAMSGLSDRGVYDVKERDSFVNRTFPSRLGSQPVSTPCTCPLKGISGRGF